ncbi:hypothetical protein TKK_0019228 [Trichogramma kaykai]|uniref:Glycosyl hydrolase family 13 catalytic domain-containing protein n=1 Tax=Trichogramma kaykai TaxID=54128 RepID=A0ABD2VTY6_9HYME
MSGPKDIRSSGSVSESSAAQNLIQHDQQEEERSDYPLLVQKAQLKHHIRHKLSDALDNNKSQMYEVHAADDTMANINTEDGLAFLNIVNSSCKPLHDEPSSRDPMVETSSNSGSSSDANEPVCTQLLTQLNTAYTHLAPDAQALFSNQDIGGIAPLTGIQLVVPKPPKNYAFTSWNWPIIRKTFFWSLMSIFAGSIAFAIGIIATMPKSCDPAVEWWQGSFFYEIFPASYQDSYQNDGIGDLNGIAHRLDYLDSLGVRVVRLNPIFKSQKYPLDFTEAQSLTEIDPVLGSLRDFQNLIAAVHDKKMSLVLDLPLHPYVKDFGDEPVNYTLTDRLKRDIMASSDLPSSDETMRSLLSAPSKLETVLKSVPEEGNLLENHPVTKALEFWKELGVDGFYLKGLERYTDEINFSVLLRYWKGLLGPKRILMCSQNALDTAQGLSKKSILNRMDLIDVTLRVANGTRSIKNQVSKVLKGPLFQKAGNPWVHWSTGSVDTPRLASVLKMANASVAVAIMGMMLPGTPSVFYGDEVGLLNAEEKMDQNLAHLSHLVPMRWDNQNENDQAFTKALKNPWIPASAKPADSNLTGLLSKMSELRSKTTTIYVKAILKNKEAIANGDVRYSANEIIVIERWYPRRNTYVFVANLGVGTQTKDLSTLYYGGHVVVGSDNKLEQNIYFRELTIPAGEAFVIKLDK